MLLDLFRTRHPMEDRLGCLRPDERLGGLAVVGGDEAAQLLAQCTNAGEYPAVQTAAFQLREPTFHGIEPGRAGGCEVQLHPWISLQEFFNLRRLMSAAVVEDHVQIQGGGYRS